MRLLLVLALAGRAFAQDSQDAAKREEKRSCTPCHSLRLVRSQRLKPATWDKEIDKMIGWGAIVPDRQLLLAYLSEEYGDGKRISAASMSADASNNK